MGARRVAAAAVAVTAIVTAGCWKQGGQSDEIWDFASSTDSTAAGTPHDICEHLTGNRNAADKVLREITTSANVA